jgi:hypothetical protein
MTACSLVISKEYLLQICHFPFQAHFHSESGDRIFLRNVSKHLPDYMLLKSRISRSKRNNVGNKRNNR